MGRIKRGLDYFPLSTGFINERMVRRIMKHEGDSAFVILVETFSYIYAGKGYYVTADSEFYDELADNLYSADLDDVKRVIALSVEYGVFDAGLFRQYNILTSAEVQRQYLFVTRRRSGSLIEPVYCLLEQEEVSSYRPAGKEKRDNDADTPDVVTLNKDNVTLTDDKETLCTHNKTQHNTTNQSKIDNLPNPPTGGEEERGTSKGKRRITQEEIDRMQIPNDGTQRNFEGLLENLRFYKVPPTEQYAIILKSNFGAIGNSVWKGIGTIRGSNSKIKLPGHYLLSVLNQ